MYEIRGSVLPGRGTGRDGGGGIHSGGVGGKEGDIELGGDVRRAPQQHPIP